MFRNIVLATDLTGTSHRHEDFTLEFAHRVGARLYPTFVFRAPGGVYSFTHSSTELIQNMKVSWQRRLEGLVQRASKHGVEAVGRFRTGDPASQIREVVGEECADLVIAARHHQSPLQGFLMGSRSEGIVREAGCPVLVLPEDFERKGPLSVVICGIDFSRRSHEALAYAIRICENFGMKLVLVHAVEYQSGPPDLVSESDKLTREMKSSALSKLREWAKVAGAPVDTDYVVDCDTASGLILKQADRAKSALILIGKQGQVMHNGTGLGSTVGSVLRRSQVPILVHQ